MSQQYKPIFNPTAELIGYVFFHVFLFVVCGFAAVVASELKRDGVVSEHFPDFSK